MIYKDMDMDSIISNDFFYSENPIIQVVKEISLLKSSNLENNSMSDVKLLSIGINSTLRDGGKKFLRLIIDCYINNTQSFFTDTSDNYNEGVVKQYRRVLMAAKHIDTQKPIVNRDFKDIIGATRIFVEKNYFSEGARHYDIYRHGIPNEFIKFKTIMDKVKEDKLLGAMYGQLGNPGTVLYNIMDNYDKKGFERFQKMVNYILCDEWGIQMMQLAYLGDYGLEVIPGITELPLQSGKTFRALDNPNHFSLEKKIKLSKR